MNLNRLLEVNNEKAMCERYVDSSLEACFACSKVKGVSDNELREYHRAVGVALRKAAEYEQLEREGLLKVLPCNPGRMVHIIDNGEIHRAIVQNVLMGKGQQLVYWERPKTFLM